MQKELKKTCWRESIPPFYIKEKMGINYNYSRRKTIFPDRESRKYIRHWWTIKELCPALVERIKEQKDSTVLVTGKIGSGKSTMVGKACFQFFEFIENPKIPGEMMWNDENYIVDPEKFAARMAKEKGKVLWLDEAIDSLSRRNWHSKINNLIVNRKNKNRKNGLVSFVVLPYEKEVDQNFIKHINMWIWIYKRGEAQIFIASNNRKGGQSLSVDKIIEREDKWWKENPNAKYCPPSIHPEFIGFLRFNAFLKDEEKRYNKLVEDNCSTGKLSEEEEQLLEKKEQTNPDSFIPQILDDLQNGLIKSKKELWDKLKELTDFSDSKLIKGLNRHLKIRGLKSFSSLQV